jgi:uncharacterized protein (DUF433 family)
MVQPVAASKSYRSLSQRSGSSYRELFVCGTSLRAQSLVSDLENTGMSPEQVAAEFHIPVEAVLEAIEYVHENEDYLTGERHRSRQRAMEKGYLKPSE